MAVEIKTDIEFDFPDFDKQSEYIKAYMAESLKSDLSDMAKQAKSNLKSSVKNDSGSLEKAIKSQVKNDKKGLFGIVGISKSYTGKDDKKPLLYAAYVEFGTSKMKGINFLGKAVSELKDRISNNLKKAAKRAIYK